MTQRQLYKEAQGWPRPPKRHRSASRTYAHSGAVESCARKSGKNRARFDDIDADDTRDASLQAVVHGDASEYDMSGCGVCLCAYCDGGDVFDTFLDDEAIARALQEEFDAEADDTDGSERGDIITEVVEVECEWIDVGAMLSPCCNEGSGGWDDEDHGEWEMI